MSSHRAATELFRASGNQIIKSRCKAGAFPGAGATRMGQIFSPAADTWMRLFMAGAASLAAGSIVFAVGLCPLRLGHRSATSIRRPSRCRSATATTPASSASTAAIATPRSPKARAPACRRPTPA